MSRWPNKHVIGLTGNIATGKSVVRQMLQHSGAYTIDADSLAHQAMMPGAPAYKPVVDTFGQFIVGEDGRINRKLLGSLVFSNPTALKKLEAITHPVIRQAINALVTRSKQRVIVIEAIKLLEGEMKDWVDAIWVVNAKPQTQYKRLISKRKMSEDDAKRRIQAQGSQSDKLKQAHVVIDNDGNIEQTWKQVQLQWAELRKTLTGGKTAQPQEQTAQQQAKPAQPKPQQQQQTPPAAPKQQAQPEPPAAQTNAAAMPPPAAANIVVKRGTPNNAQQIADFINTQRPSGENVTRMDVMMSFGQKSYLVAQDDEREDVVALLGWTVENLVTRMDEFFIKNGIPVQSTIHKTIVAVEAASKELQSEAAFLFLGVDTADNIIEAFKEHGYASITLKEIKIPVWREAVEEAIGNGDKAMQVLWKQLRQDRVLQPI